MRQLMMTVMALATFGAVVAAAQAESPSPAPDELVFKQSTFWVAGKATWVCSASNAPVALQAIADPDCDIASCGWLAVTSSSWRSFSPSVRRCWMFVE
jgi:hypothetical protein